jgi:tetratricopeptide (TPR) repeat protein
MPFIGHRIGINTGHMIAGNFGSKFRFDYTAMGDAVNQAAWLERGCRQYSLSILIGETTYEQVKEIMVCRKIDKWHIIGRTYPEWVYELLGENNQVHDNQVELAVNFEEGLKAYIAQDWDEAEKIFNKIHGNHPDDGPTSVFLDRLKELKRFPLLKDWDGVYRTHREPLIVWLQDLEEMGRDFFYLRRFKDALRYFKKAIQLSPHINQRIYLAAIYGINDQVEEAKAEVSEILRIDSAFNAERYIEGIPFESDADRELLIEGLRRAELM